MLQIHPGIPGKGALYIPELILQGAQTPGSGIIPIGKVLQVSAAMEYFGFQPVQFLLLRRQQHIAVVDQALKLLGEVVTNLLVYYFYQLVRKTN